MQNATAKLLFLLIVTGVLFTACAKDRSPEEINADQAGSLEEALMGTLDEEESGDDDAVEAGTTNSSVTEPTSSEATSTGATESSLYKDGTYSAEAPYSSPAGAESMGVTLVIKGDKVSSVSITNKATNEASIQFQDLFAQGVSAQVVGKALSSLGSLGAVNGASLTPMGFNTAVASIQALAKN